MHGETVKYTDRHFITLIFIRSENKFFSPWLLRPDSTVTVEIT